MYAFMLVLKPRIHMTYITSNMHPYLYHLHILHVYALVQSYTSMQVNQSSCNVIYSILVMQNPKHSFTVHYKCQKCVSLAYHPNLLNANKIPESTPMS